MINQCEEPVRVLFHLNGNFTKVVCERTVGVGVADGGITLEIPTEKIPVHLRKIGSRFTLIETKDTNEILITEF